MMQFIETIIRRRIKPNKVTTLTEASRSYLSAIINTPSLATSSPWRCFKGQCFLYHLIQNGSPKPSCSFLLHHTSGTKNPVYKLVKNQSRKKSIGLIPSSSSFDKYSATVFRSLRSRHHLSALAIIVEWLILSKGPFSGSLVLEPNLVNTLLQADLGPLPPI